MNAIKLISGGIDSYILSRSVEGANLYIDIGQRYAEEEKEALKRLGVEFELLTIRGKSLGEDFFIPNRNLTFAALASMYYHPSIIYMGGVKDDISADESRREYRAMSAILSRQSLRNVKVISPFWRYTKDEIVQNFPYKEELKWTFSCYTPIDGKPCGDCPACLRRTIALETNGIDSGVVLSHRILEQYEKDIYSLRPKQVKRFFEYLRTHDICITSRRN